MIKRTIDILAASLGLLVFGPILLALALLVRLDSPGPALFAQVRLGKGGKTFQILKLRSMYVAAGSTAALTSAKDRRITRLGRILRAYKLDELPQLINVLLGQMSLVGPRPEVPSLLGCYTDEQFAQLTSLRPGLTDYASIAFRDESALLSADRDAQAIYRTRIVPRKVALIRLYIERESLVTDLKIIAATLIVLVTNRVPSWLALPPVEGEQPSAAASRSHKIRRWKYTKQLRSTKETTRLPRLETLVSSRHLDPHGSEKDHLSTSSS